MSVVTKSARKSLIWLGAILVAVYGLLSIGVATSSTSWTPGLALDLAGGRQIILSPELEEGATQEIDQEDLETAVDIIRDRIDATGVAEAEIAVQGDNVVVGLPGTPSEQTIALVAQAAQLQFRPVLVVGDPRPVVAPEFSPDAEASPQPESSPEAEANSDEEIATDAEETSAVAEVTSADAEVTSEEASEEDGTAEADGAEDGADPIDVGALTPTPESTVPDRETESPSSFAWLTPELLEEFEALDCFDPNNYAGRSMGNPDAGYVACAASGAEKLVMGPVEVTGGDLDTASSGPRINQAGSQTGDFEVRLQFNSAGADRFAEVTTRMTETNDAGTRVLESPRDQFAVVLDGVVITPPVVNQAITNGEAQISGNFTQEQAAQLASQLKFGALPLSLEVQSNQQISSTLGADQLEKGIIAGLIGLALVMIWSLLQYRGLGIVVISSLTIVGVTTYGAISLLSWGLDYRLSLAGVAGLIIAIGITADSFVVYFERVKDELRDGRSIQSAVDFGWRRARRTILASDAVQLIAAVTLYSLAVGGVRGFAFTLGLTTVLDLIVTFMFTHPLLVLLARTNFFGQGHKWSGLDPRQLGRESIYRGRGRVTVPSATRSKDGLTLAERKAAQRKAEADAVEASATDGEES